MVSGNNLIVYRLFTIAAYKLLRAVLSIAQFIWWRINGVQQELQDIYDKKGNNKVHVVDVLMWHKYDVLQKITKDNFLYFHKRFDTIEHIFNSDDVTLLTLNDEEAIFVQSAPGVHVWRSSISPFIRLGQLDNAKQLIFVPITTFLEMSNRLNSPKNIVYLFNTARCGSTLLTQMCEETKICVCTSEPDSLNILAMWYANGYPIERVKKLTKDTVKWICRPYTYINPQAYVIKITAPCIELLPILQEVFPEAKNIFMYRDFIKVSQSLYRMSQELPSLRLAYLLGQYSAMGTEMCIRSMGYPSKEYRMKCPDEFALGIIVCIVTSKVYLRMRQEGKETVAVRYEDMVNNKEFACRSILKYCGLPESCVESALKGLQQDSQRNSPISASILRRHKDPVLSDKSKAFANDLLKQAGMPLLGACPLFEGTITAAKD